MVYWCAFASLLIASIAVRVYHASWFPFGYAGHSLIHYRTTRLPIYKYLFHSRWNEDTLSALHSALFHDQHGPQSFLEAILTPIFGVGLTETRLIVATLGLVSVLLAVYWGTLAVNRVFGLFMGLAVSFAPHHLTFSLSSESEHINVYWSVLLVLVAAQLVIQRGRMAHFVMLGVASGLTAYVYAPTIIVGPVIAGVLLLFAGNPFRARFGLLITRAAAYLIPLVTMLYPLITRARSEGKLLPVRAPTNTDGYKWAELERLWSNFNLVRYELFTTGSDVWFHRPLGGLSDPTIYLVIPGLLLFFGWGIAVLLRPRVAQSVRGQLWQPRARMFAVTCVLALTVFGVVPAIFSPFPYFRRLIVTALGITILQGAGLYAIVWMVNRCAGRIVGALIALLVAITYARMGWYYFRYDVKLADNVLTFETVEVVREASKRVANGESVVILLPENTQKLYNTEVVDLLRIEYGSDEWVPSRIRTIFPSTSIKEPIKEAIMPADAFRAMEKGIFSKPQSFVITNPRIVPNREREAIVIVDLVPS